MAKNSPRLRVIAFEVSGRRDIRFWGLFLMGLVFMYGGFTIDPASNCGEGGDCAPWLVPIVAIMGVIATLGGLSQLLRNASRGSHFDLDANRLDWWQNRTAGSSGDCGTIAVDQIGCIRIKRDSDCDEISLYDRQGERLAFFDMEVIPGTAEGWADRARDLVPTLRVEIVG